jgi:hypothetical protein
MWRPLKAATLVTAIIHGDADHDDQAAEKAGWEQRLAKGTIGPERQRKIKQSFCSIIHLTMQI